MSEKIPTTDRGVSLLSGDTILAMEMQAIQNSSFNQSGKELSFL
jgi:hypothetical protein